MNKNPRDENAKLQIFKYSNKNRILFRNMDSHIRKIIDIRGKYADNDNIKFEDIEDLSYSNLIFFGEWEYDSYYEINKKIYHTPIYIQTDEEGKNTGQCRSTAPYVYDGMFFIVIAYKEFQYLDF